MIAIELKKFVVKKMFFFLRRPKKISNDYASMHDVIFHALNKLNQRYKYIILLQPTSPLRKLNLVYRTIKILNKKKNFDSLIHLARDKSFTGRVINNCWKPDYGFNKRTQDIKEKFLPTGNLYVYRSYLYEDKIKLPKKTYGLVSSKEKWVDIDNSEDLKILNYYLKNSKIKKILITCK